MKQNRAVFGIPVVDDDDQLSIEDTCPGILGDCFLLPGDLTPAEEHAKLLEGRVLRLEQLVLAASRALGEASTAWSTLAGVHHAMSRQGMTTANDLALNKARFCLDLRDELRQAAVSRNRNTDQQDTTT